jgi:hypothetical protein
VNKEDDATGVPDKRSLLYRVSESFEGGERASILGMEKYFDPALVQLKNVTGHISLGQTSTTHGGFDNDGPTKKHVIKFIKQ